MKNRKVKLSVIIPAYNEEDRIGKTLEDFCSFLRGRIDFELIVVLNGCRDNTLNIVKACMKKYSEVSYKDYKDAIGKGPAIIEGFKFANGELISYADADGATPIGELYKLVVNIGDYDGIIGSRWLPNSKILIKQPLKRRIASRGFNMLVKLLLGLHYKDTQCGSKVFKTGLIKELTPFIERSNWAFDVSILYEAEKRRFKIREYPIIWENKGGSKLNLIKTIPQMFKTVIRIRLKNSVFQGLIYGKSLDNNTVQRPG